VALIVVLGAAAYLYLGGVDLSGEEQGVERRRTDGQEVNVGEVVEAHVASVAISAGQGGSLSLPDGALLSLPAGSLSQDGTLRVRKLVPGLPDRQTVVFYDVTLEGAKLAGAATLSMPLDVPDRVKQAADVSIKHRDDSTGKWERLEGVLAEDGQSIAVELKHFSPVVKVEPDEWSDYWNQVGASAKAGPLPVPYYSQAQYEWCWAASLAMVEGYAGGNAKIWELAARRGVARDEGSADSPALARDVRARHPDWDVEANWFWSDDSLRGYLAYHLDHHRPVWVGVFYAGHAVVVVGYDASHVYVHDPSGQLLAYTVGETPAEEADEKGALASYKMTWKDWLIAAGGNWTVAWDKKTKLSTISPFAWVQSNQTLVIKRPAGPGRTLSLQLPPARSDSRTEQGALNASYTRTVAGGQGGVGSTFEWEGTETTGFILTKTGGLAARPEWSGSRRVLSNDDRLFKLKGWVSNSGKKGASVVLRALLDGNLLGEQTSPVTPGVNADVEITPTSGPNLLAPPMTPGPHTLRMELLSGAHLFDFVELEIEIVPSMVRNVTVERIDEDEIELSWDPVQETSLPGVGVVYDVYKSQARVSHEVQIASRARVAQGLQKTEVELKAPDGEQVERGDEEPFAYSVWARDSKTDLGSIDAVFVEPTSPLSYFPLAVGTRLEYTYTDSAFDDLKLGLAPTLSEIVAVPREGEMVTTETMSVSIPKGAMKMTTVINREFTREKDRLKFHGSQIEQNATYVVQKNTVKGGMRFRETVTAPAELITDPKVLKKTPSWSTTQTITTKMVSSSGIFSKAVKALTEQQGPGMARKIQVGTQRNDATYKVAGYETVTVPYGTFQNCLKLVVTTPQATITQFYAPGIGPIKEELRGKVKEDIRRKGLGNIPSVFTTTKVLKDASLPTL